MKSYESAVAKLKEKQKEQQSEYRAKEAIVEQYLRQIKQDHDLELENLHSQIAELSKATRTPSLIRDDTMDILRTENSELRQKIADTELLVT